MCATGQMNKTTNDILRKYIFEVCAFWTLWFEMNGTSGYEKLIARKDRAGPTCSLNKVGVPLVMVCARLWSLTNGKKKIAGALVLKQ